MSNFPINILNIHCHSANKQYQVATHTHNCHQVYYVHEGKVNYTLNSKKEILSAGDCLIISPGIYRSPKGASHKILYIAIPFEIDLEQIDVPEFSYEKIKLPLHLQNEMKLLIDESRKPDLLYPELYFKTVLLRLILSLLRNIDQKAHGHQNTPYDKIVESIEQFLVMNLSSPISREDISQLTGYSTAQVARIFKKVTGKTIVQKLTELRISSAETMLRTSSLSITEIAVTVGFNSFSHFTQLFKSKVNLSPSDYRNKYSVLK